MPKKGQRVGRAEGPRVELGGVLARTDKEEDGASRDPGWWGSSTSLSRWFTTLGPRLLLQLTAFSEGQKGDKGSPVKSALSLRT